MSAFISEVVAKLMWVAPTLSKVATLVPSPKMVAMSGAVSPKGRQMVCHVPAFNSRFTVTATVRLPKVLMVSQFWNPGASLSTAT